MWVSYGALDLHCSSLRIEPPTGLIIVLICFKKLTYSHEPVSTLINMGYYQ